MELHSGIRENLIFSGEKIIGRPPRNERTPAPDRLESGRIFAATESNPTFPPKFWRCELLRINRGVYFPLSNAPTATRLL